LNNSYEFASGQQNILTSLDEMEALKSTVADDKAGSTGEEDEQTLKKLEEMMRNMNKELTSLEATIKDKKGKPKGKFFPRKSPNKGKGKSKSPKKATRSMENELNLSAISNENEEMIEEISNQVATKLKNMFD